MITRRYVAMVANSENFGQRRANYNSKNLFVEKLLRIITTSTDQPIEIVYKIVLKGVESLFS